MKLDLCSPQLSDLAHWGTTLKVVEHTPVANSDEIILGVLRNIEVFSPQVIEVITIAIPIINGLVFTGKSTGNHGFYHKI